MLIQLIHNVSNGLLTGSHFHFLINVISRSYLGECLFKLDVVLNVETSNHHDIVKNTFAIYSDY